MVAWIIAGVCIGLALLAGWFALSCYRELYKWARQCQHARIVVAYKSKVSINAPLVEWLMWCNQLDQDKDSNGRVVFQAGGARVAIIKKSFVDEPITRKLIRSVRPRRRTVTPEPPQARARQGTWHATDQTKR